MRNLLIILGLVFIFSGCITASKDYSNSNASDYDPYLTWQPGVDFDSLEKQKLGRQISAPVRKSSSQKSSSTSSYRSHHYQQYRPIDFDSPAVKNPILSSQGITPQMRSPNYKVSIPGDY